VNVEVEVILNELTNNMKAGFFIFHLLSIPYNLMIMTISRSYEDKVTFFYISCVLGIQVMVTLFSLVDICVEIPKLLSLLFSQLSMAALVWCGPYLLGMKMALLMLVMIGLQVIILLAKTISVAAQVEKEDKSFIEDKFVMKEAQNNLYHEAMERGAYVKKNHGGEKWVIS